PTTPRSRPRSCAGRRRSVHG
ncbi:hypothetical protein HKBW3S44_01215, partial [Candidatus Hakubella thermalkaliphila]